MGITGVINPLSGGIIFLQLVFAAHLVGGNQKNHRETGTPPWRRQYRGIDLGFTLEYPGSDTPAGDLWPGATDLVGFKKGKNRRWVFQDSICFFWGNSSNLKHWGGFR